MPEEESKGHNVFLYILLLSCFAVVLSSFYNFYFRKNYDFIVETSCDQTKESCFYRDCDVEGSCPPNNLSYYNEYTINAKDFYLCKDEDCTEAINSGLINAEKTECAESDFVEGYCVAPVGIEYFTNASNLSVENPENE
jgi:hypothetical protein